MSLKLFIDNRARQSSKSRETGLTFFNREHKVCHRNSDGKMRQKAPVMRHMQTIFESFSEIARRLLYFLVPVLTNIPAPPLCFVSPNNHIVALRFSIGKWLIEKTWNY